MSANTDGELAKIRTGYLWKHYCLIQLATQRKINWRKKETKVRDGLSNIKFIKEFAHTSAKGRRGDLKHCGRNKNIKTRCYMQKQK